MKRILIIEDDETLMSLLVHALRKEYEVSQAHSAAEAAAMDAAAFDLLIVDQILPDGRGHEVAGELTARNPALPVLVVSGYATGRDRVESLIDSRSDFLEKPFEVSDLRERVAALLRG